MKTFTKKFVSAERFIKDLEAREYMPAWAIPKIYNIDTDRLTAEYEFLTCPLNIEFNTDLYALSVFVADVHKHIEKHFTSLFHANKGENIPQYEDFHTIDAINQKILSLLGISNPCLPVKIGDLKPEHLFLTKNNEIKICDYETVGLGLLLEDIAFFPICCEATPTLNTKPALRYYIQHRFGIMPDMKSAIRSINMVSAYLAEQVPFLREYKEHWLYHPEK